MRACSALLAVAVAVCLCIPAYAFQITGTTTPAPVDFAPCPVHPGCDCTDSASSLTYLPTGRNADFEAAWNAVLQGEWDPAGWTLSWSNDAIDAVLNATTYRAASHDSGAPDCGAELRIQWSPTSQQTDLRWIQALHTNRPRSGKPWYLDIGTYTANRPPLYLYQYPDQHFYDYPTRNCEAGQDIFWEAYLYLARVDRTNKVATIYDGVQWGFDIECTAVPEPSGLIALIVGPALLVLRKLRVP